MPGYDSAQRSRQHDDLGRWRFAAEIADVIRATPSAWSARIGIFGKWGEGKSTILHFLEEMLRPDGNVVFYFTPWAVQTLEELWEAFGYALLEALEANKVEVEPPYKIATRQLKRKLEDTAISDMAQGAAALFGKEKVLQSALGMVGKWLRPDGAQVKKIRDKLGDKRVIVFIDDLDRATPELLPKLLLSLREILDLPGFTFVLAFDDEIVADGLVTANSAWGNGKSFLDKILDFHYYLPEVSDVAKHALLTRMLALYADFVPAAPIEAIGHLLPRNPRKLKRLVRGLISLKPQLNRHGTDELNWVEIWLAEMVRQESNAFFLRLLTGDTIDRLIGMGYKIRQDSRGKSEEESDDSEIRGLIVEVGVTNEKQVERLVELVKATRDLSGLNLSYNWKFAHRPETITWKEFNALVAKWNERPISDTLAKWLAEQAAEFCFNQSDIEVELFQTLLNAKENAVSNAAEQITTEGNQRFCAQAGVLLKITEQFLTLPDMATPERFSKIYEKSVSWIAFRVNPADVELRNAERDFIYSLVESAFDDEALSMFDLLKPWDDWPHYLDSAEAQSLKREVGQHCISVLIPKIEKSFSIYVRRPGSLRLLFSSSGSPAFRYIMFSPDRLPWSTVVRDALFDSIENSEGSSNAYDKASELLDLLVEAGGERQNYIRPVSAQKIMTDRAFVAALWKSVTSRHLQSRMLKLYLFKRDALLRLGALSDDLPLTPSLLKAAAESNEAAQYVLDAVRNTADDLT